MIAWLKVQWHCLRRMHQAWVFSVTGPTGKRHHFHFCDCGYDPSGGTVYVAAMHWMRTRKRVPV